MDQQEYDNLISETPNVDLVRPHWDESYYHKEYWISKDITVLICQRKTNDLIRLCIESLLRFYPDIPIYVVDGTSSDSSSEYLKIKQRLHDNITIWTRNGVHSHGLTMHDAMRRIKTKYVLLMDSDIITIRGGWVEGMMSQFLTNTNLYATGTLMLVSRKNQACGVPFDKDDVLRYAHPSCSIYDRELYFKLPQFCDHGAPCYANMIGAEEKVYDIGYYPVDKYVAHLSGGSWTIPRTVWKCDYNTFIRPFITFICLSGEVLWTQTDKDFDVVYVNLPTNEEVVIHGNVPVKTGYYYNTRFNVTGEFVVVVSSNIQHDFVKRAKEKFIKEPFKIAVINDVKIVKRQLWQETDALQ